MREGEIYYEIPMDDGSCAVIQVPLPQDALDEWKIRQCIRWSEEMIERLRHEAKLF
jgi:hypothetical protein